MLYLHMFAVVYIFTFHSFIHSFIYSFVRSFIYSFVHSFIRSFVRSFIHSFIRSFIHSFIRSFIHAFVRAFIHSFLAKNYYIVSLQGELFRSAPKRGRITQISVTEGLFESGFWKVIEEPREHSSRLRDQAPRL